MRRLFSAGNGRCRRGHPAACDESLAEDADIDAVAASHGNGVLTVSFPRLTEAGNKEKVIAIEKAQFLRDNLPAGAPAAGCKAGAGAPAASAC